MPEEQKKKNTSQDWGEQFSRLIREINTRNVVLRRQDGATVVSLPGIAALAVAVIIPQLAVMLVIGHLLELIKLDITRTQ